MDIRILTKLTDILSTIQDEDAELIAFVKAINVLSQQYGRLQTLASATKTEADNTQLSLETEALTRANEDTTLQNHLDTESNARVQQDITLQRNIDAEALTRANRDTILQNHLDTESNIRYQNDVALQLNIDAEALNRYTQDTNVINWATNSIYNPFIAFKNAFYGGRWGSWGCPPYNNGFYVFGNGWCLQYGQLSGITRGWGQPIVFPVAFTQVAFVDAVTASQQWAADGTVGHWGLNSTDYGNPLTGCMAYAVDADTRDSVWYAFGQIS